MRNTGNRHAVLRRSGTNWSKASESNVARRSEDAREEMRKEETTCAT